MLKILGLEILTIPKKGSGLIFKRQTRVAEPVHIDKSHCGALTY